MTTMEKDTTIKQKPRYDLGALVKTRKTPRQVIDWRHARSTPGHCAFRQRLWANHSHIHCHQAVSFSTGQMVLMICIWKGNWRSGITLCVIECSGKHAQPLNCVLNAPSMLHEYGQLYFAF